LRRASSGVALPTDIRKQERSRPSAQSPTPARGLGTGTAALLVTALVLLVTLPATGNAFVYFDDHLYLRNQVASEGLTARSVAFAFTTVETLYWHPLAWLSHEFDIELFGSNAAGHHFTSVLVHALAAGVLCLILLRLGLGAFPAAAGSLLWALHPLRVESFAWIAERKDVLCALFFLATIAAYLRYLERPSRARYAAWLSCGALALMSKPAAVSLPVVLLLLDFWPRRRNATLVRLVAEKLPLAAMAAAVTALTVVGQVRAGATNYLADVPLRARLATAAVSYARYLGKVLWPVNLACFYPYRRDWPAALVAASVVLLAAISALAIAQRKRRPWLLVGWCWFVVAVLPNSGIIQVGRQSMADRFTHLGTIGLTVAAVWTAVDWAGADPRRRKLAGWAAGAVILAFSVLTVRQIGFWRDTETLFTHAIAVEDSDFIRANFAQTLTGQGRNAEAERQLFAAVRLAPGRFEHHNNLANALLKAGRLDEAARESAIALELNPNYLAVAETAGMVSLRREDYAAALAQFDRAIHLGGDPVAIAAKLSDAGASLASHDRPGEAEPLIRRALELNPRLAQARRNLVLVLVDQGRGKEARLALDEALRATGPQAAYRDLERELEGGPTGARRGREQ
jgi:Flp pilus assembly protein TadD